jgi:hypothetical protein
MRNAMLIPHTPVAKATIIFFLFQMAILTASMSFGKGYPRRICTCEAPSTAKKKRRPDKQRSGKKVIKWG